MATVDVLYANALLKENSDKNIMCDSEKWHLRDTIAISLDK